ncbi:uncharacterized protein CANTADRAFT_24591 [Suhomyces tanzawaensis NRRL Y-17324]|uniref:Uncharacterized protein n=1 Tax=Suhomyces tanzawaensis NRRL Y-17324 TaxID=984487 RepID=A0A1E4SQL2_9ASCO|nr:uncharacterized protein CANTADRAFT_24591 [Suhomyces tanzawaensis NRRL Y-17324]ODV81800.1 hypothetical protein CANTADRAFT_24591 [Suhomyces tanzawaensis NRRL Y-17324]
MGLIKTVQEYINTGGVRKFISKFNPHICQALSNDFQTVDTRLEGGITFPSSTCNM